MRVFLLLSLALLAPLPAAAQAITGVVVDDATNEPVPEWEWLTGLSIGMPGYRVTPLPPAFTVGMHFLRLPVERRTGIELSIGTAPLLLAEGGVVLGARAGVTFPGRPSPDRLILPTVGASFLGGPDRGGWLVAPAINFGVAYAKIGGMRLGITWHWFWGQYEPVWLIEFGALGRGPRP